MIDFIKQCENFMFITAENNIPHARPFGAIMEHKGDLFVTTNKAKDVYKQVLANSNVQLVAIKRKCRDWVRITGEAEICNDLTLKEKIFVECPILQKRFESAKSENFILIRIKVVKTEKY